MNWLKEVAKFHDDYLRIVKSYGEEMYAEDIVQEMYLRLSKYADTSRIIQKNGKLNRAYIHFTLRNIHCDLAKERKKHNKVNIEECRSLGVSYDYISKRQGEAMIEARIQAEVRTWEDFDRNLFKLYRDSGMSIRTISKRTRIGTSTIFLTIKYCKQRIKENIAEDYEDYINEDYEKI
tara:strand:+ start:187 stop:720 length:534 start_codon:yes stop_codon:yes gene_type:complete